MKHRIVFLHAEWAGYLGACTAALAAHPDVESVHVIHWDAHPDAPFELPATGPVVRLLKSDLGLPGIERVLDQISPTALLVSGWIDRQYLAAARAWRPHIPVVLCMDNRWRGTWKQRLAATVAPHTLHRFFDRIWVPGAPQMPYAVRLGFPENRHRYFRCGSCTVSAPAPSQRRNSNTPRSRTTASCNPRNSRMSCATQRSLSCPVSANRGGSFCTRWPSLGSLSLRLPR